MQKGLVRALGVLFLVSFEAARCANIPVPKRLESARAAISRQIEQGRLPSAAIAVVRGDRVIWAEGFGSANIEKGITATADTIYRLASVSKPLTATGLMILRGQGLVDLDHPANDYLPGAKLRAWRGNADAMTVRRLANHTAGLPTHWNFFYGGAKPPPMDETIRRYGFATVVPGTVYAYSNLAYGILSTLIETRSGTPWREFMERRVYDPIGMASTSDRVRPGLEGRAAQPYRRRGDGRFAPVEPYAFDHPGASAVWSSANDLARFMRLHLNGGAIDGVRLISEQSALDMRSGPGLRTDGADYGLGWGLGVHKGQVSFSHSGRMPGVATLVRAYPRLGIALIVLTNSDRYDEMKEVENTLAEAVLPDPDRSSRDEGDSEPSGAKSPEKSEVLHPADCFGRWRGRIVHFEGDIPLEMEFTRTHPFRVRIGAEDWKPLKNARIDPIGPIGEVFAKIPTQPNFHGAPLLKFRLNLEDGRLRGVASARAFGYFALAHWVELDRVEKETSGNPEP